MAKGRVAAPMAHGRPGCRHRLRRLVRNGDDQKQIILGRSASKCWEASGLVGSYRPGVGGYVMHGAVARRGRLRWFRKIPYKKSQ
ncbi:Uncharacterised protein [Bordetella pertussis]|nr:Uncharacterised protein [Bordetella pertussis]